MPPIFSRFTIFLLLLNLPTIFLFSYFLPARINQAPTSPLSSSGGGNGINNDKPGDGHVISKLAELDEVGDNGIEGNHGGEEDVEETIGDIWPEAAAEVEPILSRRRRAAGEGPEVRKVVTIQGSSEESDNPESDNYTRLPCNSEEAFILKNRTEVYYIESENFGKSDQNYKANTDCKWIVKGVGGKRDCVPQVRCNKVDLRYVQDEYLGLKDIDTGFEQKLVGSDHFHKPKSSSSKGIQFHFKTNPSALFRRHFDGFRCKITCSEACDDVIKPENYCIEYTPMNPKCPPLTNQTTICEDSPVFELRSPPSGGSDEACQPEVVVPLLPGKPRNITITFDIEDPPLDFFLLIDASASFRDDKDVLVKIANDLLDAIRSLSSDVAIGIGLFIDKTHAAIDPTHTGTPNDYQFKVHMPLTDDEAKLKRFKENIKSISIGRVGQQLGGDEAEDQLSGLHQAAVCTCPIQWRRASKRLILIATDNEFHQKGKLPKTKSFRDKCHLHGAEGKPRTAYLDNTSDYPSIQQTVGALKRKRISVVFAITKPALQFYSDIISQLGLMATAGELEPDSRNLATLTKEQYEKLQNQQVELKEPEESENLYFRVFTVCDGVALEGRKCPAKYPRSKKLTFIVEATLFKCPSTDSEWNHSEHFQILGLPRSLSVLVQYKFLCI